MFEPTSRYADQATATHTDQHGRVRTYVTLREVPPPVGEQPGTRIHEVADGDRLDRLAWRHYGDPEQYWRLCDLNGALWPSELLDEIGRRLVIDLRP